MITQKKLKELFSYNSKTGIFTRKIALTRKSKVGDIVGSKNNNGYLNITYNGKQYWAHRLAWLYVYGMHPDRIDHINHNPSDNRIINLRDVSQETNKRNSSLQKNNKSGVSGVYLRESGQWVAQIFMRKPKVKNIRLGVFDDKFEAICARMSANNKYGFHPNHGR